MACRVEAAQAADPRPPLQQAASHFDAVGMALYREVARAGVKDPVRLAQALAPGIGLGSDA